MVCIIGVLILYPVAIVVSSVICIILIVTFWFWVPVIMVICYLFNILIFQFESSRVVGGVYIRSFPLFTLFFVILIGIMEIAWGVFRVVISPILSALYTFFLCLQRGFRTLTDRVMLLVFRKLGRTPSRDTAIAKKISGPGMSRSYFYSINEEDVYVLVQAALEKLFFHRLQSAIEEKIEEPNKKYREIMGLVLKPFGQQYPSISPYNNKNARIVEENKQKILNRFRTQCNQYLARYPHNPHNVRFTQEEIDAYFDNSMKIVTNFVEKMEIEGWVFDSRNILYEDYEELTRQMWCEIFGCGEAIFEPLEKIDSRFKLEDVVQGMNSGKMKASKGSVINALRGEISL